MEGDRQTDSFIHHTPIFMNLDTVVSGNNCESHCKKTMLNTMLGTHTSGTYKSVFDQQIGEVDT